MDNQNKKINSTFKLKKIISVYKLFINNNKIKLKNKRYTQMTYVLIIYHQKNYIIQMNRKKININVE